MTGLRPPAGAGADAFGDSPVSLTRNGIPRPEAGGQCREARLSQGAPSPL